MKKICICVPTKDRSEMIKEVLEFERDYYRKSGVDVIFYDSSETSETESVIRGFIQEGYSNITYKRTPSKQCIDYKIIEIWSKDLELLKYDYICLMNDSISILPDSLVEIIEFAEEEYDLIRLPIEGTDNKDDFITTDIDEWFHRCSKGMAHMASTFMNTRLLMGDIDWLYLREKYVGGNDITEENHGFFFTVGFYLERISELSSFRGLKIGNRRKWRRDSPLKNGKSYWNQFVFETWAKSYVETILKTPDCYSDKEEVIKGSDNIIFGRFERQSLISLRIQGMYSTAVYYKYKKYWPYVTTLNSDDLLEIAMTPVDELKKKYGDHFGQINRWSENLSRIEAKLGEKDIIIYGAGLYGEYCVGQLIRNGYRNRIVGVAVSDESQNVDTINGIKVRNIDSFRDLKDSSIVIVATLPDTARTIQDHLRKKGYVNIELLF